VRAVALYLAQNTGRRYDTLFSDETDGPLDPERKRMFMAMKRRVLELGGYAREFFVSQTPELTAMADAVIDLESMTVGTSARPPGRGSRRSGSIATHARGRHPRRGDRQAGTASPEQAALPARRCPPLAPAAFARQCPTTA
jgi:hypothetical protein